MSEMRDSFLIFSERLKYLRENSQLTQQELSEHLNERGYKISDDIISSFERGITEPKLSQINAICSFFNTTPNFMFGYSQMITKDDSTSSIDYVLSNKLSKHGITIDDLKKAIEVLNEFSIELIKNK